MSSPAPSAGCLTGTTGRRPGSISSSVRRRTASCMVWRRRRDIPSWPSLRSSAARIRHFRLRHFCRWRFPGSSRSACLRARDRRIMIMTCARLKTLSGCMQRSMRQGIPVALVAGQVADPAVLSRAGFRTIVCINPEGTRSEEALRPEIAKKRMSTTVSRLVSGDIM